MALSNIEKWIGDKNRFLCMFALEMVSGVEDVHTACQIARSINLQYKLYEDGFLERWQNMYSNSGFFLGETAGFLFEGMNNQDKEFISLVTDPNEFTKQLVEEWQSITKGMSNEEIWELLKTRSIEFELGFKNYLQELKNDSYPPSLIEPVSKKLLEYDVLLFYFRVWMPCWLEYGEYVPNLMTKASNGNPAALEKLIHIDRLVLEHPVIRLQWHKLSGENDFWVDDLNKAIIEKPLENMTMTNLKYLIGSLIYEVFKRTDAVHRRLEKQFGFPHPRCKVSQRDIYRLFQDYARDVLGLATDPDLTTPSAMSVALTRNKKFWDNLSN